MSEMTLESSNNKSSVKIIFKEINGVLDDKSQLILEGIKRQFLIRFK